MYLNFQLFFSTIILAQCDPQDGQTRERGGHSLGRKAKNTRKLFIVIFRAFSRLAIYMFRTDEASPEQQGAAANQQTVSDVECGPRPCAEPNIDEVADSVNRIAIWPSQSVETQPVVEVSKNAGGHATQRDRQHQVPRGAGNKKPINNADGGNDREGCKQNSPALAEAEQAPFIETGCKADDVLPEPIGFAA